MGTCPSEAEVSAFVEGRVGSEAREQWLAHLDACSACRELVAALAGGGDEEARTLAIGDRVGRYVVEGTRGRGGMGVVLEARDEALDRRVALKIVGPSARGSEGRQLRARLLREAQALAKLSHPNVVAIYDVVTHGEDVVIAMELVEGLTLRQWLHAERPGWRRVLTVLMQAGRGLAAAHAAGLLHRDFKPDNVLVGADGRTRVADFGLASLREPAGRSTFDEPGGGADLERPPAAGIDALTAHGMRLGTPAYMAPEQHDGATIDERADVFAFCVTLFEAVARTRPFVGRTPQALLEQMRSGPPRLPLASRAPAWLCLVIARGLEPRPEDRWASMHAVLAALDRAPARRRMLAIGGVAISLGAVGLLLGSVRQPARCDGAEAMIDEVWASRRDAVQAAFEASPSPLAGDAFARTDTALRTWTGAWADAWRSACTTADAATARSEEILDIRMACLADRRQALGGLVDALSEADIDTVHAAVAAAGSLPSIASCERDTPEAAPMPEDPELAAEVEEVRKDLQRARGLHRVARQDAAIERARAAVERAEALAHAPTRAEARLVLGTALARRGEHEEARTVLEQAYFEAVDAAHPVVARDAAIELAVNVGYEAGQVEDGRAWARHAEAWPELLEGPAAIRHLAALGRIAVRAGDYADARDILTRAVALAEHEAPDVLAIELGHLGTALAMLGELDAAESQFRRAMAIQREALGERHPEVAVSMGHIANVKATRGDWASAAALHEDALALLQAAYGPDHPRLADIHNNVAISLREVGRVDASIEHLERSIALRTAGGTNTGEMAARAYVNLGHGYLAVSRHEDALVSLRRGLDACPRGEIEHPVEGNIRLAIGMVHWHAGDPEAALDEIGRALEIWTARLSIEHPQTQLAAATLCAVRLEIDPARSVAAATPCDRELGDLAPGPAVRAWVALRRGDREAAERFAASPVPDHADLVEQRAREGIARELARPG